MNAIFSSDIKKMVTIDYIHLNRVLTKMVGLNTISIKEKESILNKAGLLKLSETEWIEKDGSILRLN